MYACILNVLVCVSYLGLDDCEGFCLPLMQRRGLLKSGEGREGERRRGRER